MNKTERETQKACLRSTRNIENGFLSLCFPEGEGVGVGVGVGV